MINQLHISTVNHNWSDTPLVHLNRHNIDKIVNAKHLINCFTSPEDLSFGCVHQALNSAIELHIIDIDFYNTNLENFDTYGRLLNELVRQQSKIVGTFDIKYHSLLSSSRPTDPVLWSAGCSITYGVAISANQRYTRLVAESLGRQEICLARGGASIFWAADRILRADLNPGDIVVWGITNVARVEIANDWKLRPVPISGYSKIKPEEQYWDLNWFSSPTQTLMALHYIDQVQNFCKKTNAELYIVNVLDITWVSVMLAKYPNYLDLLQNLKIKENMVCYTDYGYDNQHPGPVQHQQWAGQLLEFINNSKNC